MSDTRLEGRAAVITGGGETGFINVQVIYGLVYIEPDVYSDGVAEPGVDPWGRFDQNLSRRLVRQFSGEFPDSRHLTEVDWNCDRRRDLEFCGGPWVRHRLEGLGLSPACIAEWTTAEGCSAARNPLGDIVRRLRSNFDGRGDGSDGLGSHSVGRSWRRRRLFDPAPSVGTRRGTRA